MPHRTIAPIDSELVIGLVGPLGADLETVAVTLSATLDEFGRSPKTYRLSNLLHNFRFDFDLEDEPEAARIESRMNAGNELRRRAGKGDAVAMAAVAEISRERERLEPESGQPERAPKPKAAHILNSLKHPDEIDLLRRVYGPAFFVIAFGASEGYRKKHLVDRGIDEEQVDPLMARDEAEDEALGQQLRKTFHLADAFVHLDHENWGKDLDRVLELLFGNPFHTPRPDEHRMFLAYASALRSGDLSRQVGAVIVSREGELIATGMNEVPKFGGGLYWCTDENDRRDLKRGFDANQRVRDEIVAKINERLRLALADSGEDTGTGAENHGSAEDRGHELIEDPESLFEGTGLLSITEFGRAVHAEMEALLACARSGTSPRKGILYTTVFPCHNCAKHIVAAGIRRVVYIEPYPKSRALDLHADSMRKCERPRPPGADNEDTQVRLEPFVGVGPRRFFDLFSLNMGSGVLLKRKDPTTGKRVDWEHSDANPRLRVSISSYIQRELLTAKLLEEALGEDHGED